MDHQRPYLRSVLGFLGMTDIETEGVAMGPEGTERELTAAKAKAESLAAALTT